MRRWTSGIGVEHYWRDLDFEALALEFAPSRNGYLNCHEGHLY